MCVYHQGQLSNIEYVYLYSGTLHRGHLSISNKDTSIRSQAIYVIVLYLSLSFPQRRYISDEDIPLDPVVSFLRKLHDIYMYMKNENAPPQKTNKNKTTTKKTSPEEVVHVH